MLVPLPGCVNVPMKPPLPTLKLDNVRRGFFTDEDVHSVLAQLPDWYAAAIEFAWRTGWRIGEVKSLAWAQVDFRAGSARLEPGTTVLPERDRRRAVDRDVVVVVEVDELAETEIAGERRRFVRHALHQVAVRGDAVDAVIDDLVERAVVALGEEPLSHAEADPIRKALTERPGSRFDAGGVMYLGMARS